MKRYVASIDRFLIRRGLGEGGDYETAPFCGHYHTWSKTALTHSHYHEGYGEAVLRLGLIWVHESNVDEGHHYIALRPNLSTLLRKIRRTWGFFTTAITAGMSAEDIRKLIKTIWSLS